MKLEIMLPSGVFLDTEVDKVVAECSHGNFCLLPRHIDMSTALVPGIFSYVAEGEVYHLAVDSGVLVKQGESIRVASRAAVTGEIGTLEEEVRKMEEEAGDAEKSARSAVAKLEANFVRGLIEVEK